MSDYINSMRKSVDDLNIKTNNQLVEIQRILDDRLNNLSAQIDEVMNKSDMSAVERDIRKIVTEFDSIKRNRDAKDKHVHELEKKIEALGKKVNTIPAPPNTPSAIRSTTHAGMALNVSRISSASLPSRLSSHT